MSRYISICSHRRWNFLKEKKVVWLVGNFKQAEGMSWLVKLVRWIKLGELGKIMNFDEWCSSFSWCSSCALVAIASRCSRWTWLSTRADCIISKLLKSQRSCIDKHIELKLFLSVWQLSTLSKERFLFENFNLESSIWKAPSIDPSGSQSSLNAKRWFWEFEVWNSKFWISLNKWTYSKMLVH